jgi:uncharacterized membrane protein (DUF485 family)
MYTSKRIELTIIIEICWLVFITLFLAFNPARLGIWQSTAAVLTSGFIAVGTVALTWVKTAHIGD